MFYRKNILFNLKNSKFMFKGSRQCVNKKFHLLSFLRFKHRVLCNNIETTIEKFGNLLKKNRTKRNKY